MAAFHHRNDGLFDFFFNDTATTEIYTLSLHDALPISPAAARSPRPRPRPAVGIPALRRRRDRKSTRLNSSHVKISYAAFCMKKKTISSSPPDVRKSDASQRSAFAAGAAAGGEVEPFPALRPVQYLARFLVSGSAPRRDLHSFPTRRSSD